MKNENFLKTFIRSIKYASPYVKTITFGLITSIGLSGLSAQEKLPYCDELSYDLTEVSYVKFPDGTTLEDIAILDLPELHTKKSVYHKTERLVDGVRTYEKVLMNRVNGVGNWKNGIRVTEFDSRSIKNYRMINGIKQHVRTIQLSEEESKFFTSPNSLFSVKGLLVGKNYHNPEYLTHIFKNPPIKSKGYTIYEDVINRIRLYKLDAGGKWYFITDRTLTIYTETSRYNKIKSQTYRSSIFNEPLADLLNGSNGGTDDPSDGGSGNGTGNPGNGGSGNAVYEEFVRIYKEQNGVKLIRFSSDVSKDTLSNGLCVDRVFTEEYENYNGCELQNAVDTRSQAITSRVDINVFPNPLRGDVFTISLPKDLVGKDLTLQLFDALGNQVVSQLNQNSSKEILFSGMELRSGVYFLRISGDDVLHTKTLNVIR